jgi:ATP-dependent Clp protease ATP-binding subunit ClpA
VFERFTDEARQVVVAAQSEARHLRAEQIEPVHLLLGIAGGPGRGGATLRAAGLDHGRLHAAVAASAEELDAEALAAFGVDLDRVRAAAEAAFGPGALDPPGTSGHLRFADASKKSLEQALRHVLARRGLTRRSRTIDSGCVLVGVLAVQDPLVSRVLGQLGVDPGALREQAAERPEVA